MNKDTKSSNDGLIRIPEVRFNLKDLKKKSNETLIKAIFRYNGNRFAYSTQHYIEPNNWNPNKQEPRSNYNPKKRPLLNSALDKIKEEIISIYSHQPDISPAVLRMKLDKNLGRKVRIPKDHVQEDVIDFKSYLKNYIQKIELGNELKKGTAQKYLTLLNNLNKFNEGLIDFESIDLDFKDRFVDWRYNHTKAKSQNTLNKDIECIKKVLKKSFKDKLHKNNIFTDEEFAVKRESTSIFALTENEVNRLYEFDFSENPRLEKIRDWFLVSCWSALRWSDFSTLEPEHFIKDGNDNYLKKKSIKTGELVHIPIDDRLYNLLEKYNFKSISITNQKFNNYLKEVFEIAGFIDTVMTVENIKGISVEVKRRKCDIISAHDGRRTWSTIHYLKGLPTTLLMQVTGHHKEQTFLGYVGASSLDKARKLKELLNSAE